MASSRDRAVAPERPTSRLLDRQHARDRRRDALPVRRLLVEMLLPGARQRIELRAAIVSASGASHSLARKINVMMRLHVACLLSTRPAHTAGSTLPPNRSRATGRYEPH